MCRKQGRQPAISLFKLFLLVTVGFSDITVFSLGQAYGWEHSILQTHFLVIKFEKVEIEHPLSKFAVVALFP